MCELNKTFGFDGRSYDVALIILVTSGVLIAVIWEMIVHHRRKMAAKSTKMPTPVVPQATVKTPPTTKVQ